MSAEYFWQGKHVVYRVFGDGGEVLYIGCSSAFGNRWRSHELNSAWFPLATRVRTTLHRSRRAALDVEAREIRTLRPRFNVKGRRPVAAWSACDWVEVIEATIARRGRDGFTVSSNIARTNQLVRDFERIHPDLAALTGLTFKQVAA